MDYVPAVLEAADALGFNRILIMGHSLGAAIAGQDVRDIVPLARWGETHDIGLAAVFLASAAGGYVNAETLVVDGGHWHDSARAFWQGREALRAMSQQRRSKL